ncbi:hypothetical protein LguiA_023517 [Lonicera macranthoides]
MATYAFLHRHTVPPLHITRPQPTTNGQVIAGLQHRNRVRFLGFCLEEEDEILVYEHMGDRDEN